MNFRKYLKVLLFIVLLFFIKLTCFSQKNYTLEIVDEPINYFEIKLNLRKVIFMKTKGFMNDLDGHSLKISERDVHKINRKEIQLIHMGSIDFYKKPLRKSLNLVQISDSIFYIKKLENRISKKHKNLFLNDTIVFNDIHKYSNNAKDWIDLLDNDNEVKVLDFGCAETPTGGFSIPYITHYKISELARKELHKVFRIFRDEVSIKWDKKEWLNWFENKVKD